MKKILVLFTILLSANCNGYSQKKCGHSHSIKAVSANDTRSDSLDITHTHLTLQLTDFANQILQGEADISFTVKVDNLTIVDLDLESLTVTTASLNGEDLAYTHDGTLLRVTLNEVYNENDTFELHIEYEGAPITDSSGWGGFYWTNDYAYNLGVGFDAAPHSFGRAWFPCFDNFVERCTYSFTAYTTFPKKAFFNGLPDFSYIGFTDDTGVTLNQWTMDNEISSYLVGMAVGEYDVSLSQHFTTENDSVPIWLIAPNNNLAQVESSFTNLSPAISSFEEFYGDYQWSKVGYSFVPFNGGAMEHATNIAYPLSLADGSLDYETLMAHELAHHWWGDYVTCSTAEDMWINEGMASYSEALFMEQLYGADAYYDWITDNHRNVLLYAHSTDGAYLPVSGIGHENTYGAHVYNKGASVGHNLRTYMGDNAFKSASESFMSAYALQSVSSEQMRNHFQNYTTSDLTSFFADWIYNPGFTDFSIDSKLITEISESEYPVELTISQRRHEAPSYFTNMPVEVTIISAEGIEETHTVIVSGEISEVSFISSIDPIHIILNRDYNLTPAILAEEKLITDTGLDLFSYAEFRSDINEMNDQDSVWMRVECHFTGPHETQPQEEYLISSDRFWRIIGDFPEELDAGGRIRYYGSESSGFTFDEGFFNMAQDNGYSESELKLVYRENTSGSWSEHLNYELNTLAVDDDYIGRIDFLNLKPGDYTWGFSTGETSITEISSELLIYPNPVIDIINLSQNLTTYSSYKIIDLLGRVIQQGAINGSSIKCKSITPGSYAFQFYDATGKLNHQENFILVKG
jgi:hypothetical protein